jgi:hypothetical protein
MVADAVDPRIHAQQRAPVEPPLDLARRETGGEQLRASHNTVRATRESRQSQRCRPALTTHTVV